MRKHRRGCGGAGSPTEKTEKRGVAGRRLSPAQGVDAYRPIGADSGAGGAAPSSLSLRDVLLRVEKERPQPRKITELDGKFMQAFHLECA